MLVELIWAKDVIDEGAVEEIPISINPLDISYVIPGDPIPGWVDGRSTDIRLRDGAWINVHEDYDTVMSKLRHSGQQTRNT